MGSPGFNVHPDLRQHRPVEMGAAAFSRQLAISCDTLYLTTVHFQLVIPMAMSAYISWLIKQTSTNLRKLYLHLKTELFQNIESRQLNDQLAPQIN